MKTYAEYLGTMLCAEPLLLFEDPRLKLFTYDPEPLGERKPVVFFGSQPFCYTAAAGYKDPHQAFRTGRLPLDPTLEKIFIVILKSRRDMCQEEKIKAPSNGWSIRDIGAAVF